jgi:LacI family transcriptional regulator
VDRIIESSLTIKDIARLAGVSHSTVSRALNDNPRVSQETREKIKAIAESLQFEFHAGARSLSSKRRGIIGVIYHSGLDSFDSSLYTNQLFVDLRHGLESISLDAILLQPYNPVTGNSNIARLIRQKKVDGFLIVDQTISRAEYDLIKRNGLPVVQLHMGASYYPIDDLDHFLTDNVAGGEIASSHLVDMGCKRIATLTSNPDLVIGCEFRGRREGYRLALERGGLSYDPDLVFDVGPCSYEAGYSFVRSHAELMRGIDGIFAQADIVAFGCIAALKDLCMSVPGDVRVMGYDDCSICNLCHPAISTVHQRREELVQLACERLNAMLEGEGGAMAHVMLPPSLVVRGSTDPTK